MRCGYSGCMTQYVSGINDLIRNNICIESINNFSIKLRHLT